MNKLDTELELLLGYTDWLMQRAATSCRSLPAGIFIAPTVFPNGRNLGQGSLRDTLLHMAVIEQRWVGIRLLGQPYRPLKEAFPPQNYPDVDSIMDAWRTSRAMSLQYLSEHAGELDVPREVTAVFGSGTVQATPRDLLTHALTHTIGHRSDLSSQFSFHGLETPEYDYVIYLRG